MFMSGFWGWGSLKIIPSFLFVSVYHMPIVFSQGRRASVPLYLLKAAGHLGGALHAAAARTGSSPAAAKKKQEAAWYLVQVHHNPLFLRSRRPPCVPCSLLARSSFFGPAAHEGAADTDPPQRPPIIHATLNEAERPASMRCPSAMLIQLKASCKEEHLGGFAS